MPPKCNIAAGRFVMRYTLLAKGKDMSQADAHTDKIMEASWMKLEERDCVPCEGGVPPLDTREEDELHSYVSNWELDRRGTHKLRRAFKRGDFTQTMELVNRIADVSQQQGHHPDMHVSYGQVVVEYYTHAICGLSINDFIMAAKVNVLAQAV